MLWYIRLTRALTKSGVFLLGGVVFLFMGITKDTYVDWNTEYALYVLIGGILLFLIGIVLFIRNFAGSTSNLDAQQEDFLMEHIAPEEKRKYLAVGAFYSLHPYLTVECLKKFYLQKPEEIEKGKQNTEESWGITDNLSAKNTLDWLLGSGHRNDEQTICKKNKLMTQLMNPAEMSEETSVLYEEIHENCSSNFCEFRLISEGAAFFSPFIRF